MDGHPKDQVSWLHGCTKELDCTGYAPLYLRPKSLSSAHRGPAGALLIFRRRPHPALLPPAPHRPPVRGERDPARAGSPSPTRAVVGGALINSGSRGSSQLHRGGVKPLPDERQPRESNVWSALGSSMQVQRRVPLRKRPLREAGKQGRGTLCWCLCCWWWWIRGCDESARTPRIVPDRISPSSRVPTRG